MNKKRNMGNGELKKTLIFHYITDYPTASDLEKVIGGRFKSNRKGVKDDNIHKRITEYILHLKNEGYLRELTDNEVQERHQVEKNEINRLDREWKTSFKEERDDLDKGYIFDRRKGFYEINYEGILFDKLKKGGKNKEKTKYLSNFSQGMGKLLSKSKQFKELKSSNYVMNLFKLWISNEPPKENLQEDKPYCLPYYDVINPEEFIYFIQANKKWLKQNTKNAKHKAELKTLIAFCEQLDLRPDYKLDKNFEQAYASAFNAKRY